MFHVVVLSVKRRQQPRTLVKRKTVTKVVPRLTGKNEAGRCRHRSSGRHAFGADSCALTAILDTVTKTIAAFEKDVAWSGLFPGPHGSAIRKAEAERKANPA